MEDRRNVPGAGLLCGAGALALLDELGGLRPPIKLLAPLSADLWAAAGGSEANAPDWAYVGRQVLQRSPSKRAAMALFTARVTLQASVRQTG
jgi:hypothetical protein